MATDYFWLTQYPRARAAWLALVVMSAHNDIVRGSSFLDAVIKVVIEL